MSIGDFGKTTVQRAGTQSASQGDVSSGLNTLARGIQSFQNPLTHIAAQENDRRLREARREGEDAGELFGLKMDDQGNLVPPDLSGIDRNTAYGRSFADAAEGSYFSNLQTAAATKASVLAAKSNGNSAVFEELAQADIESQLENIPDELSVKAEALLRTSYALKRGAVIVEEQRKISAEQVLNLEAGIETSKQEARDSFVQGDPTGGVEQMQRGHEYLENMQAAGHIGQAEFDQRSRDMEVLTVQYGLEGVLKATLSDPELSERQQIAQGMDMLAAFDKMSPEAAGLATTEEQERVRDNLFSLVRDENSRRVQVQNVRDQGRNKIQKQNAGMYVKREAAGLPISPGQALQDFNSDLITLETYRFAVKNDAARVEAARAGRAAEIKFQHKNNNIEFQQIVLDQQLWGSLNNEDRLDMRQAAIDRTLADAELDFEDADAKVNMTLGLHPLDYEKFLVESGIRGKELVRRNDAYIRRFYDPNNPQVVQSKLDSLLAKGFVPEDGSKEEGHLYKQHQAQLDIYSPEFDAEFVGGLAAQNYVIGPLADQITAAVKTRSPENLGAAVKAFNAICTSTSRADSAAGCVALQDKMSAKDYGVLEELSLRVTSGDPLIGEVFLDVEKSVASAQSDLSSVDRKVQSEGGEESVATAFEQSYENLFNAVEEAEPSVLGDFGQSLAGVDFLRHLFQLDDPELRASLARNPQLAMTLENSAIKGLISNEVQTLIAKEPKGRQLTSARMQELTQQGLVKALQTHSVSVRTAYVHPVRSDGTIDFGEVEPREELVIQRGGAADYLNRRGAPFTWTENMVQGEAMMQLMQQGFGVPQNPDGTNATPARELSEITYDLEPVRGKPGQFRVHYLDNNGNFVPYTVQSAEGITGTATIDMSDPVSLAHTQMWQQAQEDPRLLTSIGGAVPIFGDAIRAGRVSTRLEEASGEASRAHEFFQDANVPPEAQMVILPPIGRVAFGLPAGGSSAF